MEVYPKANKQASDKHRIPPEESYPTSPCGRRQLIIEAASGNLTDLLTVECALTMREPLTPLKSSKEQPLKSTWKNVYSKEGGDGRGNSPS
ncbi:hypothetical protein CDAR_250501 [Caerostris darwini]|uniref:Uncharacterized protein n=1 Tax=Caerostris darwini TaxID=1538125 RepID=A0AAV4UEY4_9ARAC|nr:hypothetical protein CDAR_250501 [Caerostris darwini]